MKDDKKVSKDVGDNLGVDKMETDDLTLVLEETQPEAPVKITNPEPETAKPVKKRVPLTTIPTGTNKPPVVLGTPEKAKGRRVSLITLSSPKPKC